MQSNPMQSTENNHRIRVLRFEFSSTMIELTKAFTEVHQYDDRKTYKEAWTAWLAHDEIAAMLKAEVARLTDLGYQGDVADKLFKSGRYYFRQKTCGFPNLSLHADTKLLGVRGALVAPRKYVLLNHALLDAMDDHIERGLRHDDNYTPASGFADFCKLNANSDSYCSAYRSEVARLSEIMPKADSDKAVRDKAVRDKADSDKAVRDKLKKTYKNRYCMIATSRK